MPEALWMLLLIYFYWTVPYPTMRCNTGFPDSRFALLFASDEQQRHLLCDDVLSLLLVWIQLEPDRYSHFKTELTEHHALREDQVRSELARRLRCICGNLSESDFQELVSKMAERQLLDERRLRW